MVRILTMPGESERTAFLRKFRQVCEEQGVNHKHPEAKYDFCVRKELNKRMSPFVRGRMTPVREGNKRVFREGRRLLRSSLFHSIYPRKLKTDKQKFIHLQKLFVKGEISKKVFQELSEVLRL